MWKLNDIETSARIKLALIANPNIGGYNIGVETINGIVVLTGMVESPEQKDLAAEIAIEHGGVDIKNDIELLRDMSVFVREPGLIGKVAGQAGSHYSEDNSIRQRVIGALGVDPRVNSATMNVDEVAGIVRLSGFQETEDAKHRAEDITGRVIGVHRVVNDIEVRSSMRRRAA
jgi:osmotically-inducible protein OsmY